VLAQRLKTLAPSATLAVQAKAKELRARGVDVISFGAGEPDFDTPHRIKEAAAAAMPCGHTKYPEVGGVSEVRSAVCAKFKRDQGLDYEPADILVSCGAKHTLFNIMVAVLDPGDEVIVPSPFWVSYPEQVRLVGGVPVVVETVEASGFDLDGERVRRAVTPRTKVIIVNSPNNPTGAVFSRSALEVVARIAIEHDLLLVSDECYEALTFEGRHLSVASLGPDVKARTLVVNTCSKAYAMTGWRIGFAAGPRALIRAMTDVQSQVTSNPSSIAQYAAVEALTGPQDDVAKMAGEFDHRRRVIVAGLNALPRYPACSAVVRRTARRSGGPPTSRPSCSSTPGWRWCLGSTSDRTLTFDSRTRRAPTSSAAGSLGWTSPFARLSDRRRGPRRGCA
jgi:aspartate aminotransferase